MSNFLPYAIIAGIVIVFFVICYVLYSGNGNSSKVKHEEKRESEVKPQQDSEAEEMFRHQSERRRTQASVQHARKTKPQQAHQSAKMTHSSQSHTDAAPSADDLEATRVLSRDEILAAMEKVDKEEAEAYKKREEEAKKSRQRQQEEERQAQARQLEENRKKREQEKAAAARKAKAEKAAKEKDVAQEHPLSDIASVVSDDLAAKDGDHTAAARAAEKVAAMDQKDDAAAAEKEAAEKAAREEAETVTANAAVAKKMSIPPEEDTAEKPARHSIVQEVMAENAKAAAVSAAQAATDPGVTRLLDAQNLKKELGKQSISKDMQEVADQLGQTQRMEPIHVDTATGKAPEETLIMPPLKTRKSQEKASPVVKPAATSAWDNSAVSGTDTRNPQTSVPPQYTSVWEDDSTVESPIVRQSVAHFLRQYGVVSPQLQQQTEYITAAAFDQIGCQTDKERQKALAPLIVQEALQNVQKAYAAHPDDYVGAIALQAFTDIVQCSPISTRHLVAIDALKVMPYLSQSHYQILALLLLFLYSRNSHNVDQHTFRQYIDKYIVPFLDGFPTERPYYQQLDYLHCTAFEAKETRFAEILADSYPLLFRYRGFTEEELRKALKGKRVPTGFIVRSFNSPLYKLAMVDESMTKRFFRQAGITDRSMQANIMRLAKKRPVSFMGEEALNIMEDISPILADLSDIWDSSLLRVSTLSLLGLYLAQGFIKEIIGEEFDLSRWFE